MNGPIGRMRVIIAFAALIAASAALVQATPVDITGSDNLESGTECLICEFLVKELDQYLEKPNTEKEIVGALEDVCKFVPSNLKDTCKSFIESNGNAIVGWIVSELSEQNICDDILDLGCDNNIMMQLTHGDVDARPAMASDSSCTVCQAVMKALKEALDSPSTVNNIVAEVEKICSGLGALSGVCKDLIAKWGPEVVSWLDGKIDPLSVCKDIDLCTSSLEEPKQQLLGTNPCTFGPAFWCDSMANAKKCGDHAVAFCQETAWAAQEQ